MKKVIALLLALVMVCGLVACGAKEPAVDAPADLPADAPAEEKKPVEAEPEKELEPITITWAMNETANLPAESYYAIVDAFHEAYPHITIEMDFDNVTTSTDGEAIGYETRVASGLQADIMLWDMYMDKIEGACAAMPDWLVEKFPAGYLKETFGAVRSVPAVTQGVWSIIYDKAMFEAAGVTPPETWDEFLVVCEKLKANGTTPMMLWGGTNQSFLACGICAWMAKGIEVENPSFKEELFAGNASWTDPVITERLQMWQDFANSGYIYDGFKSLDYANALAEFYDGKAAMIMEGVWGLGGLDPEKYGIFFVPDNDGNKFTTMTTLYYQVWEGSENVDACWQFIDWLMCGEGLPLYTKYILQPDAQVGCSNYATVYEMDPLVEAYYTEFYNYDVMESWMERYVYQPTGFNTPDYFAEVFYNDVDVATVAQEMQTQYDILMEEQGLRD